MGIVIGAGSDAFAEFATGVGGGCDGATQASWDFSQTTERLYELGSWSSCAEYNTPQQTLNLTFYSGSTVAVDVRADTTCTNTNIWAYVSLAGCDLPRSDPANAGSEVIKIGMDQGEPEPWWFITGYNYSKSDARQPGTESWSLMMYTGSVAAGEAPEYNVRGISEGTINSEIHDIAIAQTQTGVTFDPASTISMGYSGSVSAGQTGRAEYASTTVVHYIGGSTGPTGSTGTGQVSVPYTPLWTYSGA